MTAAALPAWLRPLALRPPPAHADPAWRYLPHCLAAALLLRLALGLFTDSISHHDELYQYLEQGHRLAFGYGVIPWEFHFGARSWVLPGFIAALLLPFKWTGLDDPAYYVPFVKTAFCLVSALIPWGLYHFTRRQHGEWTGRLALLLGCVSFYLLALAAKSLPSVVATALAAAALGLYARPGGRGLAGAAGFGVLLALAAWLRYPYAPAFAVLWLAAALAMPRAWIIRSALAAAAAWLAAGLLDWLTWEYPFQSLHRNIAFNLAANRELFEGWSLFYPQRLLFASAGGVLLALAAWALRPREHLPLIVTALAVLVPHLLLDNKEFRFAFLLLLLWIPPACALLGRWTTRRRDLAAATLAAQLLLGVLLAAGAVSDAWVHDSGRDPRNEADTGYLHGSSGFFKAMRWLHRLEELEGLLVVHNDHNYHHLHRDVPLYSTHTYETATLRHPGRKLFSHVIIGGFLTEEHYREIKRFGNLRIYLDTTPGPVHADGFDPRMRNHDIWRLAEERLPPPER